MDRLRAWFAAPGPALTGWSRDARLRRALDAVLAAALAPACVTCGAVLERPLESPACAACWARLPRFAPPCCDRCGVPLDGPHRSNVGACCFACIAGPPVVDQARALGPYEGVLRDLVHALKYDDRRSLTRTFGALLLRAHHDLVVGADAVVPVPLHWRRHWARGFNQADELAVRLGPPVWRLLRRSRFTPPQAGLAVDERERNVRAAFALCGDRPWSRDARGRIAGARLLLVDDVNTTGATLDACARLLKDAGAHEVNALTIARAVLHRPR